MMVSSLQRGFTVSAMVAFGMSIGPALAQTTPDTGAPPVHTPPAWQFSVGVGAGVGPVFEGSDDVEIGPVPLVDIVWRERVFLSTSSGLGVIALDSGGFMAGASVSPGEGRDDDEDGIRGLGDIDTPVRANLFASYQAGPVAFSVDGGRDFGGSDGTTITVGVGTGIPLSERWTLGADLSATWADEEHMSAFFGVTARQSTASGLAEFDAEAGFKRVDLSLATNYAVTDHWGVTAGVGLGFLLGDAADSPVSQSDKPSSAFLGLTYTF